MKTDRELLELAAKAAGMFGLWFSNNAPDSPMFFHQPGKSVYGVWNPLTDDGDALRLAVKLQIDIVHRVVGTPRVEAVGPGVHKVEYCDAETAPAATRRAIVRAAAAIGEAMP